MLQIADKTFSSRLFTGTGKFSSAQVMAEAIHASGSQLVTMAMKRVDLRNHNDAILAPLLEAGVQLLPNTSGAKTAEEAIFAARLAREVLGTHWVKLEIHPDARYLLPDPIETLKAAEILVKQGFVVLPYCSADPVLCRRLEEAGWPLRREPSLHVRDWARATSRLRLQARLPDSSGSAGRRCNERHLHLPTIRSRFSSLQMEVQPLEEHEYAELKTLGLDGVMVYQETYQQAVYARHHLRGNKQGFSGVWKRRIAWGGRASIKLAWAR